MAESANPNEARLAAIQASPALAGDPEAIAALARDADTWADAKLRTEARILCAEAYAGRLHRPELAMPIERAIAQDAATDTVSRAFAARALLDADLDRGDLPRAKADAGTYAALFDSHSLRRLHRMELRHTLSVAAATDLAATLALAVAVAGARLRAAPRRSIFWTNVLRAAKRAAFVALFLALAGGGLAYAYEAADPRPFFAVGAALVVLSALAEASRPLRSQWAVPRALLAASALVAASFLALQWFGAEYLAGFGL